MSKGDKEGARAERSGGKGGVSKGDKEGARAERSGGKGGVSKGDKDGEKVDAVASGGGELEMLRSWTQHAGLWVAGVGGGGGQEKENNRCQRGDWRRFNFVYHGSSRPPSDLRFKHFSESNARVYCVLFVAG